MRNYLKLTSVFILVLLMSCSVDSNETIDSALTIEQKLKMKSFENSDAFKALLTSFNSFNNVSEFEAWGEDQDFVPAYFSKELSGELLETIPFTFQFILNENLQFTIGEKLIEFKEGNFYEYSKSMNDAKLFATTESSELMVEPDYKPDYDSASKVDISANGGEYKDWEEFVRQKYAVGCSAPQNKSLRYRLVHYVVVLKTSGPSWGFSQTDVLFKLRMSQKTSSGWHYNNTSTERLFNINLTGNTTLKYFNGSIQGPTQSFSINDFNNCQNTLKGTKTYWLRTFSLVSAANFSLYNWDININGNVFHKVNGDTNEVNTTINW